ncbi:MAG: protein-glutamate O-methyltransferase CheR [Desulfamplus sp.]|nr:protein-glutamate O-methyltransferase CheR [Desulfamplus sp.]
MERQKSRAVSLGEFELLSSFIYRKTGIRLESQKLYFLTTRVNKRMDIVQAESVADYIRILRFGDPDGREFQNLINLLTVNETYFFRDFPQLQAFAEHCLDEVITRKIKEGNRKLKIWSAPCSSGEEPYTLAVILHAMIDNVDDWEVEILASDIDQNILKLAEGAVYDNRRVRDVPPEYLSRFFQRRRDGKYLVNPEIRRMVTFEHLNLSDAMVIRKRKGFDFIFCRNLLIYFDDISRKNLVDQFYIALNPGGYIFLGSSESISRISTAFRVKRKGGYFVYYK